MTAIKSQAMPYEQKSMNDRLTAFRLPAPLLSQVDDFCGRYDFTRFGFFRRSIVEFIDRHDVEVETAIQGFGRNK